MRRNYGSLSRTILEFLLHFIRGEVVIALKKMWQAWRFSQIYVLKIILNDPVCVCMFVHLVLYQIIIDFSRTVFKNEIKYFDTKNPYLASNCKWNKVFTANTSLLKNRLILRNLHSSAFGLL